MSETRNKPGNNQKGTKIFVYDFSEGSGDMKSTLGGKGANLAEMTRIGLPVPPGFTITTDTCLLYLKENNIPEGLKKQVDSAIERLEENMGKKFGDDNPLLVSVRSGAKLSMPGMMDTILNLGLNEKNLQGLTQQSGDPRFVLDSYRRLIQMFGNVVKSIPNALFSKALERLKEERGAKFDTDLTEEDLKGLISKYKDIYRDEIEEEFPQDPRDQLNQSIEAVFKSWNTKRAIDYRNYEGIPHDLGTAVNVQTMVYGNLKENSGTGVAFTRNPSTGENVLFGEYLMNAQGEDVVAGIRTPHPIHQLKEEMPKIYKQFKDICSVLEKHLKDVQDVEFTIMQGRLFILQTRDGKRTGVAAAKIAHDLYVEGLIDKETAIMRVTSRDIENSMFPGVIWSNEKNKQYYDVPDIEIAVKEGKTLNELTAVAPLAVAKQLGKGLPAGPGAGSGIAVFSANDAEKIAGGARVLSTGEQLNIEIPEGKSTPVILITEETTPEDFHGMAASVGILTLKGGMTSHAALVARQIGKRCIVGSEASGLSIRKKDGWRMLVSKDGTSVVEGEYVTIDGFSGKVYKDRLPIFMPKELPNELRTILDWCDEIAKIGVRANADKPGDTQIAIDFGAKGTGLARTEHQFFEKDRLPIVQKMILAETEEERREHLDYLVEFQRDDFIGLFRTAKGLPITIRLIDPPLHEFLPSEIELLEKIWKENLDDDSKEQILLRKVRSLKEANPMLGLRGCRLGIMYPEITEMQSRAIIEAAVQVKEEGIEVDPEIMIPLIGDKKEFLAQREVIDRIAEEIFTKTGNRVPYKVGTMIEIPRAALTSGDIAGGEKGAEFFSFGTNDLHQMTFGFSRDDVAKFLPLYLEQGILDVDPFVTIDEIGTGRLMRMCVDEGRDARPTLKVGICGEQGGDPQSIDFCYRIGLDYVSCSPYRVPIARLSAAQATLRNS